VAISADDSVTFTEAGDVTATGTGDVTVTANADDAAGDTGNVIAMADDTLIDAGEGLIALSTAGAVNGLGGGITLGGLSTTNATDTAVTLTTDAGVIDGGDALVDVVAADGRLVISAATGIGDRRFAPGDHCGFRPHHQHHRRRHRYSGNRRPHRRCPGQQRGGWQHQR
jgi:hypothetical protein